MHRAKGGIRRYQRLQNEENKKNYMLLLVIGVHSCRSLSTTHCNQSLCINGGDEP